jgi:hypothetical protein
MLRVARKSRLERQQDVTRMSERMCSRGNRAPGFKQTTISPRVDSSAITEQRFTLQAFTDVWFFQIKALGRPRVH